MTRLLYAALLVCALVLTFVVGVCVVRELEWSQLNECRPVTAEDFRP